MRNVFEELGGYKEIELMEDWDFSRRLVKRGKMKLLDTKIGTSARRFKEGGQMMNGLILMTRIPIPGQTKTRLMNVLTGEE